MKYRKLPVVIEAIQFNDTVERLEELSAFMPEVRVSYKNPKEPVLLIKTLEGTMVASVGDYIIKGVNGEFYPCKPDIFNKTYEEVGFASFAYIVMVENPQGELTNYRVFTNNQDSDLCRLFLKEQGCKTAVQIVPMNVP